MTILTFSGYQKIQTEIIVISGNSKKTIVKSENAKSRELDPYLWLTINRLNRGIVYIADKVYDLRESLQVQEFFEGKFSFSNKGPIKRGDILWASFDKQISPSTENSFPNIDSPIDTIQNFCRHNKCRCILVVVKDAH